MVTYDETLQIMSDILLSHTGVDRPIRPTDHIQNDLGLDSIAVMELVADIEDRFELNIPNEMLTGLVTVDDVARALMKLQVPVEADIGFP